MGKELVIPSNVFDPREKYGYIQAIKAGNTIYLAGQVAWDEKGNLVGRGDIVAQVRQCRENMRRILAAAGATMDDLVQETIFCRDVRLFAREAARIREEVEKEYFSPPGHYSPAGTCLQVASLWDPDMLVEIAAIAVTGG